MDFSGKVAVVTGGARGIGAAIATAFHAHGAAVVITDILQAQGQALADELGDHAHFFAHDVRDEAQWERIVDAVVDKAGGLDILVNNAGTEETQPLVDLDLAAVQRMNAVNIDGVLLGMKWGFRTMRPGGRAGAGGAIVNLSSIAAHGASAGMGPYGATKAAVDRITKVAAVEAAGYGIRVNCLYPGIIQSDMIDKLVSDFVAMGSFSTTDEVRQWLVARTPQGRLGETADVAKAALFLASDYAGFVNGAGLFVDGGFALTG
ncbi:SDR family oxidoreductase [Sphingomonas sp. S6]|jgi:3alpha(or 20beta)-hydroxysteroid dehydrogenase|uniref:SDR family NAD(P)-dependent oxidoreductase n=1 Tax=Sphingomonas sp. S6 TaxID=3368600 RepID=UPI0028EE798C|nr:SDR family oxidoreductase [uncultured Sphingomonas sp.]